MNPFRALFLSLSRVPPVMMLFVILGLAVVVTMYVMGIINNTTAEADRWKQLHDQPPPKLKVVYATRNIDEGEVISQESVEEKDVESGKAPIDALNSLNSAVGQAAAYSIAAGTIVSNHAIKPYAITQGFTGRIKDGMRALTFGVDTNSGVAGFIAPGSHVDVVAITGSADGTKAAPVMSDVEVVAVGTTYQKAPGASGANPSGSVTVTVTPEQAISLLRASSAAKLYLTLRSDHDHTPIAIVDVRDLFSKRIAMHEPSVEFVPGPLPVPPSVSSKADGPVTLQQAPPPAPKVHEIDMWSGSRKEVVAVPQA